MVKKNYRCSDRKRGKMNKCSKLFLDIKLKKLIGKGSFGEVYSGLGKSNTSLNWTPIAIKIIKNIDDINDMNKEVEFSYYMSMTGLGPEIYDAFYYKNKETYNQILIMEIMDYDCETALISNKLTDNEKLNICRQMVDLLGRQIGKYGLICIDIKPKNFVYKHKTKTVKLIDFGNDWCRFNKSKSKKIIYIYSILLLQLYYLSSIDIRKSKSSLKKIILGFIENKYFPKNVDDIRGVLLELNRNKSLNMVFTWYIYGVEKNKKYNLSDIKNILNAGLSGRDMSIS